MLDVACMMFEDRKPFSMFGVVRDEREITLELLNNRSFPNRVEENSCAVAEEEKRFSVAFDNEDESAKISEGLNMFSFPIDNRLELIKPLDKLNPCSFPCVIDDSVCNELLEVKAFSNPVLRELRRFIVPEDV